MTYTINQKVFVPGHGMGVLTEFKTMEGMADGRRFMVIDIPETGIRISIPENSDRAKNLRAPLEKPQAEVVVAALKSASISNINNKKRWHQRHKEQVKVLESGDSLSIAALVKSLTEEKKLRLLSISEKQILESASLMLKTELAYSLGSDLFQDEEVATLLACA